MNSDTRYTETIRLQLHMAAVLCHCMSIAGMLPEDVDRKLHWNPGATERTLVELMHNDGLNSGLREYAQIAHATGHRLRVTLEDIRVEEAQMAAGTATT